MGRGRAPYDKAAAMCVAVLFLSAQLLVAAHFCPFDGSHHDEKNPGHDCPICVAKAPGKVGGAPPQPALSLARPLTYRAVAYEPTPDQVDGRAGPDRHRARAPPSVSA